MVTRWNFEAEFIQSCNCDYGCPCNFNGYPTHGNCEALNGFRIRRGTFGKTKLDGVTFAMAAWWPKAIHEGNGVGAVYVDPAATADQRKAIEEIASGKHGGGVWEVFPRTFAKMHPTKTAKIEFVFKGHDSYFKVAGVGEVRSTHIKNPVTGEEFEGSIDLPNGIAWKHAEVTAIKKWSMNDGDLRATHENASGFVTTVKFTEKGCVG
jgi:hypothetical protein